MVASRSRQTVPGKVAGRSLSGSVLTALSLVPLGCSERAPPSLSITPGVEWTATEDLRIGSVDDSESAIARVGSLAVDSGGRIYVSQPVDGTIRVFDAEGNHVGTFGRPGDGPGEFRQVSQIGIFADTLYASDGTAGRVTLFSLDGRVLGTLPLIPHGLDEDWLPLAPMRLGPGGMALALPGFLPVLRDPTADYRWLLLHIDRSGEIVDTAALVVQPSERSIVLRSPFGPQMMPQPLRVPVLPLISADGSRVGIARGGGTTGRNATTFGVTVLSSIRDTVWSRSYAYEPIPISPSIVDSTVAATVGRLNREVFPDRADAERQIRQGMSLPNDLAPVSGGVFADDGDLWLRREEVPGQDQRWTVLDSVGAPVARITLPRGLSVEVVRSSTLWGVETDELGVPYVVRYTITR